MMVNLGPTDPVRLRTCSGFWPDRGTRCLRPLKGGTCPRGSDPNHIGGPDLDPRWEWTEITELGGPVTWIKGACRHLTPEEITTADPLTGDRIPVVRLCPDCDLVLWRWGDDDLPEKNGFEKWVYPDLISVGSQVFLVRAGRNFWAWHIRVWNRIKNDPAPVVLCLAMWVVIALNSGWVK